MSKRRVVITGMGALTPLGLTARESWQAVKDGVCGIAPITQFDASAQKVKLAATTAICVERPMRLASGLPR